MARVLCLHAGSCFAARNSNYKPRISSSNREISLKASCTRNVCRGIRCAIALGVSNSAPQPCRVVGRGSKLIGSGSAVPKLVVSNNDLSKLVDTSDEWISSRTGIHNRRILSGDETLTSLAVESSRKSLEMAKVKPEDVDLVLMCTSTPDDLFGGAPQVQREVGCIKALAFDITAACSGFVLGLVTATRFIKGGGFENVLVIGADALSRYVDWTDRGTCILFGDAAGAVLLQATDGYQDGLLGFDLQSDGHGQKHLSVTSMGEGAVRDIASSNGAALVPPKPSSYSCIQMNGKEVFRFAVRSVPQVIEAAMEEAGLTGSHLDWLLLHQANQRIITAVAERLQIQPDRVITNLADYGNTSAASIPLALDEAVRSGRVQSGLKHSTLLKGMTEMDTLLLVLPKMVSLPLHINNMSKLRSLSLRCCSLTTMKIGMKDDVCTLQNLKYLKFYECSELKEFQNLHKLQNLRHLEIILCPEVKEIPKEFGEKGAFPSLKIFSLVGLHNLKTLPETEIGALPSLEIFTIMDCPILRTLPESYINLRIRISVYGCEEVRRNLMADLERVDRGNMDMMQVIPGSIKTEVVINEYLQALKRRENWLFGESWCNELFLFVAGYMVNFGAASFSYL